MAMTGHGQAIVSALETLAIRFALLAAGQEVREAMQPVCAEDAVRNRDRSELAKLIDLAEQAAANEPDPIRALADITRAIAESDADPYLVMGVLVEGTIHTLETGIPSERRGETAAALLRLVTDRLRATGILDRI